MKFKVSSTNGNAKHEKSYICEQLLVKFYGFKTVTWLKICENNISISAVRRRLCKESCAAAGTSQTKQIVFHFEFLNCFQSAYFIILNSNNCVSINISTAGVCVWNRDTLIVCHQSHVSVTWNDAMIKKYFFLNLKRKQQVGWYSRKNCCSSPRTNGALLLRLHGQFCVVSLPYMDSKWSGSERYLLSQRPNEPTRWPPRQEDVSLRSVRGLVRAVQG